MRFLSPFLSVLLTSLVIVNPLRAQSASAATIEDGAPLRVAIIANSGPAKVNSTSPGLVVKVTDASGEAVPDVALAIRLPEQGPSGTFPDGSNSSVVYTDANGEGHFPAIQWNGTAGPADLRLTAAKGSAHAGLLITQAVSEESAVAAVPAPPPPPKVSIEQLQPGTLSKPLADVVPQEVSHSGASRAKASDEPAVSIVNSKTGASGGHVSRKTILLVAVIGAGAGLGAMLAMSGHGSGSSGGSTGISIGAPTISVGH